MRTIEKLKAVSLAAALVAGMVGSGASAATLANIGSADDVNGAMGTVVKGGTLTGDVSIQNTSVDGQYRSPFQGTGQDGSAYFNIFGLKMATFTTSVTRSALTFLWGSPDAYNTVKFFLGGDEVVSYSLADIPPPKIEGLGAVKVRISGLSFDRVEFITDQNSFELSNISAVPLPAGGLLLLSGLGGIAALRRRRKA